MNYDTLIMKSLQGDTPKEKYDWLMRIKSVLISIGYPQVCTDDYDMDMEDMKDMVRGNFFSIDLGNEGK